MTSPTGKKIITIDILPNVLGVKGNQTVQFGQLNICTVTSSRPLIVFFRKLYVG